MRLFTLALASVVASTALASAQPLWGPDQGRFYGPNREPLWERDRTVNGELRPHQIAYLVEAMGLDPVGPPVRSGRLFVQRASDEYGRIVRVTVDAWRGEVVSVVSAVPAGAPLPVEGGPYRAGRPYGPGPYASPPPDDDDEFAPAAPRMAPRAGLPPAGPPAPGYPGAEPPPRSAAVTPPGSPLPPDVARRPAKPATATVTPATPAKPPLPRKRPEAAEAAAKKTEPGAVTPLAPTSTTTAPQSVTPPAAPAEKPGTPPINPLY